MTFNICTLLKLIEERLAGEIQLNESGRTLLLISG